MHGPTTDSKSVWTVQSRSKFDDDGARPVSYLQLVSPVLGTRLVLCKNGNGQINIILA